MGLAENGAQKRTCEKAFSNFNNNLTLPLKKPKLENQPKIVSKDSALSLEFITVRFLGVFLWYIWYQWKEEDFHYRLHDTVKLKCPPSGQFLMKFGSSPTRHQKKSKQTGTTEL